MNKTLLGAVPAYAVDVTSPQSGGVVSFSPTENANYIPQVNADGTMNINLPEEYKGGAVVATNPEDISTAANATDDIESDDESDSAGGIKKYLPFIIGGGLLLFFLMRKK